MSSRFLPTEFADSVYEIDLEKLKTDPIMWMRLAMPQKNSDVLGNVFTGKENPFEKDSKAAMEKVKKLASEGKLYMREFGRSRPTINRMGKPGRHMRISHIRMIMLSTTPPK